MNRCVTSVIVLALTGVFGAMVQAQSLPNSGNNPYNSPIHRANPNSMQGTQPSAPAIRGPNTVPVPRPPTLDNRGIDNRYQRQPVPATPPGFIPNPPPRDSGTGNR
jgi:hypothetical protein